MFAEKDVSIQLVMQYKVVMEDKHNFFSGRTTKAWVPPSLELDGSTSSLGNGLKWIENADFFGQISPPPS